MSLTPPSAPDNEPPEQPLRREPPAPTGSFCSLGTTKGDAAAAVRPRRGLAIRVTGIVALLLGFAGAAFAFAACGTGTVIRQTSPTPRTWIGAGSSGSTTMLAFSACP